MGYALAEAARRAGARVVLVTGPTALPRPRGVITLPVTSAREMLAAVLKWDRRSDVFVAAAAVADWRPARSVRQKIKKSGNARHMTLRLIPNPDILKTVARRRRFGKPFLIGFALETRNLLFNAQKKMREKNLNMVVANDARALDKVRARAVLLSRKHPVRFFGPQGKASLARRILRAAEADL